MTTGAWRRRSPQPPYQRGRVLHRLRNHRCTRVPRPRIRRALRTGTARIMCAACQSDCIYPKGPCYKIWHRQFSKMVRYRLRLWCCYHMAGPPSSEGLPEPPCSRTPRTCLHLLTIPCSHRDAQYARGSTLFAFASPFPRPGSWR